MGLLLTGAEVLVRGDKVLTASPILGPACLAAVVEHHSGLGCSCQRHRTQRVAALYSCEGKVLPIGIRIPEARVGAALGCPHTPPQHKPPAPWN